MTTNAQTTTTSESISSTEQSFSEYEDNALRRLVELNSKSEGKKKINWLLITAIWHAQHKAEQHNSSNSTTGPPHNRLLHRSRETLKSHWQSLRKSTAPIVPPSSIPPTQQPTQPTHPTHPTQLAEITETAPLFSPPLSFLDMPLPTTPTFSSLHSLQYDDQPLSPPAMEGDPTQFSLTTSPWDVIPPVTLSTDSPGLPALPSAALPSSSSLAYTELLPFLTPLPPPQSPSPQQQQPLPPPPRPQSVSPASGVGGASETHPYHWSEAATAHFNALCEQSNYRLTYKQFTELWPVDTYGAVALQRFRNKLTLEKKKREADEQPETNSGSDSNGSAKRRKKER